MFNSAAFSAIGNIFTGAEQADHVDVAGRNTAKISGSIGHHPDGITSESQYPMRRKPMHGLPVAELRRSRACRSTSGKKRTGASRNCRPCCRRARCAERLPPGREECSGLWKREPGEKKKGGILCSPAPTAGVPRKGEYRFPGKCGLRLLQGISARSSLFQRFSLAPCGMCRRRRSCAALCLPCMRQSITPMRMSAVPTQNDRETDSPRSRVPSAVAERGCTG